MAAADRRFRSEAEAPGSVASTTSVVADSRHRVFNSSIAQSMPPFLDV
jgi:hypothetical protein